MRVLEHREREAERHRARARGAGGRVGRVALADVPAVVLAAAACRGLDIHLLDVALTDVADVEVAGAAIEAPAPWIAQPVRPDLVEAGDADEGIRRRNRVRRRVHIDPEDLAKQRVQALPVPLRVTPAATVAEAEVAVAVGTERDLPA